MTANKKGPQNETLGAENETRTRDPDLGKVVLYQLSYFRNMFWFCSALPRSGCLSTAAARGKVVLYQLSYFRNMFCWQSKTTNTFTPFSLLFHLANRAVLRV